MVTVGKSHGDPVHPLPTSDPVGPSSPPSKRDLASWWKQFKRSTRKDELKGRFSVISRRGETTRWTPGIGILRNTQPELPDLVS